MLLGPGDGCDLEFVQLLADALPLTIKLAELEQFLTMVYLPLSQAIQVRWPPDLLADGDLAHFKSKQIQSRIEVHAEAKTSDWLDLSRTVAVGESKVAFADIFRAVSRGDSYVLAGDGTPISLNQGPFRRLADLIAQAAKLSDRPGHPGVGRHQQSLRRQIEQTVTQVDCVAEQPGNLQPLRRLVESGKSPLTEPLPTVMTATLRPYQRDGFGWLMFIWRNRIGGILADDMGLGKTIQVLTLVAAARQNASRAGGDEPNEALPFLVVAPSSVIPNWLEQTERFFPGMKVLAANTAGVITSAAQSRSTDDVDLVVTSYSLFRLHYAAFVAQQWAGLILDEAQFVKNAAARANRLARALPTPFKLAVTGTPLENSLDELWAVFSIVCPSLLGSRRQFRRLYGNLIANQDSRPLGLAKLRHRIGPLLLRRSKQLVAAELPPRQEQIVRLELKARHRKLYDLYLQRERGRVLGMLGDFEANRSAVLRSLTLLRRAALDISLVDSTAAEGTSSKLDVLAEHLTQLTGAGHRALVFSQFTSYLGKARQLMDRLGIAYCYLDGQTSDRRKAVADFKQGKRPVFLISMKAGGYGLNLTEADYVYLLDPWWNPASERQAIDRAHRIGQDRPVMVFRLVSVNTIEDKVMSLGRHKQELFEALFNQDGSFSGTLTAGLVQQLID
jgi:SNF2 family DNA or RNA helicase